MPNPVGRPPVQEQDKRIRLSTSVHPDTLIWLEQVRSRTGASMGETIDRLVEDRRR